MRRLRKVRRGQLCFMGERAMWLAVLHGMEIVFFFFQAEDGIRDDLVTGVQTCALPILERHSKWSRHAPATSRLAHRPSPIATSDRKTGFRPGSFAGRRLAGASNQLRAWQIGRASCRERV